MTVTRSAWRGTRRRCSPLASQEDANLDAVSTITHGCIILLQMGFSLPIFEGLDMGESVGFQTSEPDRGPHRGVRTTTEQRARPSAQRDRARGWHPAAVPA